MAFNILTIKDKFHILIANELMEKLMGVTMFFKVDLRSRYHQIRMAPTDTFKIAFITHDDHYEFMVMPFSLTNTLAIFQNLTDEESRVHLMKFILMFFLYNIDIYNQSLAYHLQHLKILFKLLQSHQLFAKESKFFFFAIKLNTWVI